MAVECPKEALLAADSFTDDSIATPSLLAARGYSKTSSYRDECAAFSIAASSVNQSHSHSMPSGEEGIAALKSPFQRTDSILLQFQNKTAPSSPPFMCS
ncbi:hypothetical protein H6P81_021191 [Aristolochia fimbriata]|uniref:Uncharacterized protein n=1 Tax=Aristolochia fimbriata TaxID=158543 RepID=A0AAV7DQM8_ARIFI|nr:hypothetical protein H6P81_021191 [Aristolochia fimbriata]